MAFPKEILDQLPPDLEQEVIDFAQFLLKKRKKKPGKKLSQSWGGGLEEFRDQFTSLELQKKALEWRGD